MIDPDLVRRIVDEAPPLTPAQLDRVRRMINPVVSQASPPAALVLPNKRECPGSRRGIA